MKKKKKEKMFVTAKLNFLTSGPDNHRTVHKTCFVVLLITVNITYCTVQL